MLGFLVNPSSNSIPIIHFLNDRASFGIMTVIGLFSDSIHSIRFAFAPLELIFFLILLFLNFHCSFFVSSHPFIVTLVLRGRKKLLNLFLIFPMNDLRKLSGSERSSYFQQEIFKKEGEKL